MNRAKFALLIVTGCAAAMGCRMCAHPYDCYGPTWLGCPDEPTWEFERAGSAFSGRGYVGPHDAIIEGGEPLEAVPARPSESNEPMGPADPGSPSDPGGMPPTLEGTGGYYPDSMTNAPQPLRTRSALRQQR